MTVRKWATPVFNTLHKHRVQKGRFAPATRTITFLVATLAMLRGLSGTRCTLAGVVGDAGIRVFPADAPTLGLSHEQFGGVLATVTGKYELKYGRGATRQIIQHMDYGRFFRSQRTMHDLGGGGSSRNGYCGAKVWPILKKLGKTSAHAQELVDFHGRLGAHLKERLGFEMKVGSSMAIETSHLGDTALHCDGKSFHLRTITTIMADESAVKGVQFGLVYDKRSRCSRKGKSCNGVAWDYVADLEVRHGQTYGGDDVALGAKAVGRGLAVAHRVKPLDGDQWVLVIDWVRAGLNARFLS